MGEEVRIAKQVRVCVVVRLCKFSTCEIAPAHTDRRTGQPVPASLPAAIAAGTLIRFAHPNRGCFQQSVSLRSAVVQTIRIQTRRRRHDHWYIPSGNFMNTRIAEEPIFLLRAPRVLRRE